MIHIHNYSQARPNKNVNDTYMVSSRNVNTMYTNKKTSFKPLITVSKLPAVNIGLLEAAVCIRQKEFLRRTLM